MREGTVPRPFVDRLLGAHGWLVYLFFYAPIVVLAVFSFNDNSRVGVWTQPSLRWYGEMLNNDAIMLLIRNTLIVAAISTAVSGGLGTATAISMERFRFKGQESIAFGILSLRFAPELLIILPLYLMFQSVGLRDSYLGLILAYQLVTLPMLVWMLRSFIEALPPELEEAVAVDGGTR